MTSTVVVNLQRERAVRRPIVYGSLNDALLAAQTELLAAKDMAESVLLLDSADVLDQLAAIHGIVRACQRHLGESSGSHWSTR